MELRQTSKLNELESIAFRFMQSQGFKFPYDTVNLRRDNKKVALRLKKGTKVLAIYKSASDIQNNLINDINKAVNP
tara:strand:+ start:504 stop:731 length:228 start_codon:yes stop_codon:yes gene_type:complete